MYPSVVQELASLSYPRFFTRDGLQMIERVARNNRYCGASSRTQCGTTLSSFHDSFYLSHLSRDPRLASVCDGARWNSVGVIYCSQGGRVECAASRRLVEFAIKKIDAMEGISLEANLLLFHFARSSFLIRYSLESTLFHRQSDMVRVTFRYERFDDVRGVEGIRNVNLLSLPLLQ